MLSSELSNAVVVKDFLDHNSLTKSVLIAPMSTFPEHDVLMVSYYDQTMSVVRRA